MSENSIAQPEPAEVEPEQDWYFTFGSGHTHPLTGEDLSLAYVIIHGTYESSRNRMFDSAFGNRWSHQYQSAFAAGVRQFGLQQIEMPSKIWACPEGCGYHIADGPVPAGEPTTDELIADHLEEHAARTALDVESVDELVEQVEPESERAAYTRGLREIAEWLDAHPEVPLPNIDSTVTGKDRPTLTILIGWWNSKDQREDMATIGRAMGKFSKHARDGGERFYIYRVFGSVAVAVSADRDEVCERVVTGTHEVTEEVPDPEILATVPKVTVTKVVEDVTWVCSPILAGAPELPAGVA